ncbi:hypothetical protein BVI2075_820012 [Burkholderia vietnamiensis]|nr:hypothetical protein BVI2075_820012 [Burkholderia vietnamiensis]
MFVLSPTVSPKLICALIICVLY